MIAHELGPREAPRRAAGHHARLPSAASGASRCWRCSSTPSGVRRRARVAGPADPAGGRPGPRARRRRRVPGQPAAEHREPCDRGARRPHLAGGDARRRDLRADAAPAGADLAARTRRRRRWSQLWWGSHPTVLQRAGLPRVARGRPAGEPRPGRHQRLPDPPRGDRVVRAGAVPARCPPTRWSCTPPRCPAARSYDADAAVPGLPRPVARCCCRRRRSRAGSPRCCGGTGATGCCSAPAPRSDCWPRRCAGPARAGRSRSPTATRSGGPGCPVTRRLLRRVGDHGRRADLRQRVVPRPDRAGAVAGRPRPDGAALARCRPAAVLPGLRGRGGTPPAGLRRDDAGGRVHGPAGPPQGAGHPGPGLAARCCARHPGARLLLVGDGPDRGRARAAGRPRRGRAAVVFTGGVPWEEVPAYTDAGDVFAMPCRTRLLGLEPEAWGIVFLEAQACGLPVVVGDSGGAPETLLGRGRLVRAVAEVADAVPDSCGGRREACDRTSEAMSWHGAVRSSTPCGGVPRLAGGALRAGDRAAGLLEQTGVARRRAPRRR